MVGWYRSQHEVEGLSGGPGGVGARLRCALGRELRGGEAESLATDITEIVGYVSEINTITGTQDVKMKKVGVVHNVFREDVDPHEGGLYTEDLLRAAPQRRGQHIEVKKILGGDS